MLIGRKKEIEQLNKLYNSDSSELVAIYGRRRVGKTFLIDEVFEGKFAFKHSGLSPIEYEDNTKKIKSKLKEQLTHFYHSLLRCGMEKSKVPTSWLEAFYMLEDFLKDINDGNRQVIFFDEIQWLDTPKSNFMIGFEAFWNGFACHRKNIMVIVCGSSNSWVLDKLINNHGGLYDRITYQIHLQPFTLNECEQYLISNKVEMSRYDICQAYMVFGGIPYYLKYINNQYSFALNVDYIFFSKNAPLHNEFDRLFNSVFQNPEIMKKIVIAISSKNIGLTRDEIINKTSISSSGDLSNMLEALITSNFIIKYNSFGDSKRNTYYKLVDPFCLFYLNFIYQNDNYESNKYVDIIESQKYAIWRGYAYENLCFNLVDNIKNALGISGVKTNISLLNDKDAQIDLILERNDNVVNLCEIKFYNDVYTVDKNYYMTMLKKKEAIKKYISKKQIVHNVLISSFGIKKNEYSDIFNYNITLDDLF